MPSMIPPLFGAQAERQRPDPVGARHQAERARCCSALEKRVVFLGTLVDRPVIDAAAPLPAALMLVRDAEDGAEPACQDGCHLDATCIKPFAAAAERKS